MADSLFSMADSLVAKLASSVFVEASRVLGVYDDVRDICQTLSIVKAVLLDAEDKGKANPPVIAWLTQLNFFFHDAEDIMDELDFERLRKQAVKSRGTNITTKVRSFFSCFNSLVFRVEMARKIKHLQKRLNKLAADRYNFGLQIIDADRRVVHRRELTHSHVVASDVIGRENEKERVVEILMKHKNKSSLSVLPIVGLAGVGKTTLAKLVFNDERITKSFPLKLWVCVSDCYRDFNIKLVISKIINSADSALAYIPPHQQNFDKLDMEQLAHYLQNKLANQKFLLVLDDVWCENRLKWDELSKLIRVDDGESTILVTTRSDKVASIVGTVSPYILQCLSEKDSLSLFLKWAFKEGTEKRFQGLVEIAKDIVKKCYGNPLALITVGSSLFSKVDIDEWIHVRDNEVWNDSCYGIMPALKLSYDQMPSYLKQCFHLFSLYPKDYTFDSFRVASLWRAHDLLPSQYSNQRLKHDANQYLNELHSMSFLQDFVDYGIGFGFKVHDLVHDLATQEASRSGLKMRHMTFGHVSSPGHFPRKPYHCGFIKTILFPIDGAGANSEAFLNKVSSLKFLRFLDLSDSTYETLPRAIGKLKHLRYVSLENNKRFKRFSSSICKLHKLEVLIFSGCTELEALPRGMSSLISLQHLEITTKLRVLPEDEFANLSFLHTLRIEFCNNVEFLFGAITLPTLRVLIVAHCKSLKSLPLDIEHFPKLETLVLDNCDKLELSKGHDNQSSSLSLKIIHFVFLPQLVILPHWLQGSTKTLQFLLISSCNNLEMLPEWLSTMDCLKRLCITNCPNLLSIPNHLTAIEHFEFDGYHESYGISLPQVGQCSQAATKEPEDQGIKEEELE